MTIGEKEVRKPRDYQAGLVVYIVIIVVLGVGFVLTYQNYVALQSTYDNYVAWHHHHDLEFQGFTYQIAQLQGQIEELNKIVGLQKSWELLSEKTVVQGAGEETLVLKYKPYYAGYFNISMTSTTSNAYVKVAYWYGQSFNFKTTLGTSGRAIVPILPTDGWGEVSVYVGNTNELTGASHTLSLTYYY